MAWGIEPQVWNALALTGLGAAGTGLGGLMVIIQPKIGFKKLGYLQGCAAGLMLFISFFDLFPESLEAVGAVAANLWFFIGVAFFAVIVACIPEPDSTKLVLDVAAGESQGDTINQADGGDQDAAVSTDGQYITAVRKRKTTQRKEAIQQPAPGKSLNARETRKKVLLSGLITALGIALHNAPEGMAVFLASIKSSSIGLRLAIAIALHNVPEGVAVALPVYFATGSRLKGFAYAFISGLAEPAAVVVLGVVFRALYLDKMVIDCLLAAVGGIMAFLALHELLPLAIEHAGKEKAVISLFVGMAIMSANLLALEHWMGPDALH